MSEQRADEQQALLMGALRRAAGTPVSYAQLRDAGIEFPAGVVAELELEGVPIERCRGGARGGPGVRLDPGRDRPPADPVVSHRADAAPAPEPGWGSVRVYGRTRRRLVVPVLLLAVIGVVAALLLVGRAQGGRPAQGQGSTGVTTAHRPRTPVATSTSTAHVARPTRSGPRTPPTPVSPALATELEARGHDLLEAGRYGDAVPVLHRAVLATGESLVSCLEPASDVCLIYAYALYDLGRALRLSGHPAAAVPVLERRLEIDNQRPTVEAELHLASQGIG